MTSCYTYAETAGQYSISDHFDGEHFFNKGFQIEPEPPEALKSGHGFSKWILGWIIGTEWPEWPDLRGSPDFPPGPPPPKTIDKKALRVTPIGHATFLIQMDGLNILTDPIWSNRASPVFFAGPKRHRSPGIRFEDLPNIDVVLVSHNHYDHLDMSTLERIAETMKPKAYTGLGNLDNLQNAGFTVAEEFDWWQSVQLSPDVKATFVPAQHFSARGLWDRNKTLWGGFVISGPAGNVYFAGDTGYGPHFKEIAKRFSPIKLAILPIAPFRPKKLGEQGSFSYGKNHLRPSEAVAAHIDLGAEMSVAGHFQVFQLGIDDFNDAPTELTEELNSKRLSPSAFVIPHFGHAVLESKISDTSQPVGDKTH